MKPAYVPLVAAVVALFATPLLAQETPTASKPPKEKKICHKVEVTGSIMSKSTCHTAAQWEQIDKQNAQNAEAYRNRAATGSGGRQ